MEDVVVLDRKWELLGRCRSEAPSARPCRGPTRRASPFRGPGWRRRRGRRDVGPSDGRAGSGPSRRIRDRDRGANRHSRARRRSRTSRSRNRRHLASRAGRRRNRRHRARRRSAGRHSGSGCHRASRGASRCTRVGRSPDGCRYGPRRRRRGLYPVRHHGVPLGRARPLLRFVPDRLAGAVIRQNVVVRVGFGIHPFGGHRDRQGGTDGPPPGRQRCGHRHLTARRRRGQVPVATGENLAIGRRERGRPGQLLVEPGGSPPPPRRQDQTHSRQGAASNRHVDQQRGMREEPQNQRGGGSQNQAERQPSTHCAPISFLFIAPRYRCRHFFLGI